MEILGIDVGGTGIKGGLVDVASGTLVTERLRIQTPQPSTPEAVTSVIEEIVRQFDYHGPLGVGFPSAVVNGVVRTAANVDKGWIGYDGQKQLQRITGCRTVLLNDADAAGIAEMRFGAGKGQPGVTFVFTLGTGIGSALFVDGKLVPNTELGHIFLRNQQTDAESRASERARVEHKLNWKKWARRLDEFLIYIQGLFWPNLIILGGGVSKKQEKFIPLLTVETKVVPALLRNHAGIIGAAMAALEQPD